jgi:hypothetical protein
MLMNRMFRLARRLRADRRGLAMLEFALVSPFFISLGIMGIESANFAIINLRVSQAAANLADNVSRTGLMDNTGVKTIREVDINDALAALRRQSTNYGLTTYGRVIISSLERNAAGGQWIHWQRCLGQKRWPSSYGVAGAGATGTSVVGMGPAGQEIQAPAAVAGAPSGLIFVEIAYDYQPLITDLLFKSSVVTAKSAFIVRDKRTFADPNNPQPIGTASPCTAFTA